MLKRSKGRLPRLERKFRKLREELGTDELFYEFAEEYKIGEKWKLS
jgi:tRNA wybutosine-synthesizing protein 3